MTLPIAILAGGLGTRMWPLARLTPKSLIDVGGKPFLLHQLELLKRHGITDVVLCIGWLGGDIITALSIGYDYGLNIRYSLDGATLLGTGGAIKKAMPLLGDVFFVMYGDVYLDFDYAAVEKAFRQSGKQGLMTIYHNENRWVSSNVRFSQGQIRAYDSHHCNRRFAPALTHVDYGLSVLRAEALRIFPSGKSFDLSSVWRWLIVNKELAAYEAPSRFYEIGSPQGLEEFRRYISEKKQKG